MASASPFVTPMANGEVAVDTSARAIQSEVANTSEDSLCLSDSFLNFSLNGVSPSGLGTYVPLHVLADRPHMSYIE